MPQSIEVVILADGEKAEITQSPLALKQSAGQEICWRSYQGEARIRFEGDTPFATDEFVAAPGGAACSGVPRRLAVRKDGYRYSVEVRNGDSVCAGWGFEIYVDP